MLISGRAQKVQFANGLIQLEWMTITISITVVYSKSGALWNLSRDWVFVTTLSVHVSYSTGQQDCE
jgi:hypothetical protein